MGYFGYHNKRLGMTQRTIEIAASLCRLAVSRTTCNQVLVRIAREFDETVNFVYLEKLSMRYVNHLGKAWPLLIMPLSFQMFFFTALPAARHFLPFFQNPAGER